MTTKAKTSGQGKEGVGPRPPDDLKPEPRDPATATAAGDNLPTTTRAR